MANDAATVAGQIVWIDHTVPDAGTVRIVVADLDAAIERCEARGGKLLLGAPKSAGKGKRFCVIQDPAGAVAALYQSRSQSE